MNLLEIILTVVIAAAVMAGLNHIVTLEGFQRYMDSYLNGLVGNGDIHIHQELLPEQNLDTVTK